MAQNDASFFTYATVHGPITISATERGICAISFDAEAGIGSRRSTALTNKAATQIQEYLAGKRRSFDVPLDVQGTSFQRTVWAAADAIPYGTSATAARIASDIGKPGAHRSVGTALKQNKLAPFIATHRIDNPAAVGKTARIFRALRAMEAAHSGDDC